MKQQKPKQYLYRESGLPDRVLRVEACKDGRFFVCYYNAREQKRKHWSKPLPVCQTRPECQEKLDAYAKTRGLKEVDDAF